MKRLNGLTTDAIQQHIVPWDGDNIVVRLRFVQTVASWFVDVEYQGRKYGSDLMVLGSFCFDGTALPFRILCIDKLRQGIDPFSIEDLANRVEVLFFTSSEADSYRGY